MLGITCSSHPSKPGSREKDSTQFIPSRSQAHGMVPLTHRQVLPQQRSLSGNINTHPEMCLTISEVILNPVKLPMKNVRIRPESEVTEISGANASVPYDSWLFILSGLRLPPLHSQLQVLSFSFQPWASTCSCFTGVQPVEGRRSGQAGNGTGSFLL